MQGPVIVALGRQRRPLHPVCAEDFAGQVAPGKRLVTIPLPVMAGIDRAFMGGKLAPNLQIMRLLARLGERGDPAPANELLGVPDTTVEAWCRTQASTPR